MQTLCQLHDAAMLPGKETEYKEEAEYWDEANESWHWDEESAAWTKEEGNHHSEETLQQDLLKDVDKQSTNQPSQNEWQLQEEAESSNWLWDDSMEDWVQPIAKTAEPTAELIEAKAICDDSSAAWNETDDKWDQDGTCWDQDGATWNQDGSHWDDCQQTLPLPENILVQAKSHRKEPDPNKRNTIKEKEAAATNERVEDCRLVCSCITQ